MSNVHVTRERVEIRLTARERVAGLLRDLVVPRSAVTTVEVVADGLAAPHGVRAPGLGLPGVAKIGIWRAPGDTQYVVARRGQPAVRLALSGERYDTVVVGADDAEELARRLRATA